MKKTNVAVTMNCVEFEAHIDEFIANTLDESLFRGMAAHKKRCIHCANSLDQHMSYLALLSSWQEPKLADHTRAQLLTTLDQEKTKLSTNRPVFIGFASGFAAASLLALCLFITGQFGKPTTTVELAAVLDHPEYLSQEITLVINAENDIQGAELKLKLPEELSIVGEEYLAKVSLPINLKKGRNTIVIPIVLEDFAQYSKSVIVDASLVYKNGKRDFAFDLNQHLDLDAPQPSSPQYDSPRVHDSELIFTQPVANKITHV